MLVLAEAPLTLDQTLSMSYAEYRCRMALRKIRHDEHERQQTEMRLKMMTRSR